ncbi:hypothetical protein BRC86_03630 [Halobacteriales archaeon QS_3_64_16]|nr:MAG: hypothetical protein BRC86_03630 [Halobacteriales archaeon QS_3_64_16]
MTDANRRSVLKLLSSAAFVGGVGTAGAQPPDERGKPKKGRIRKMGHSLLSDPVGEYAEEDIRDDGQYGVVGSFFGKGGSFLVDLRDPTDPEEAHRVPSSADTRNADVAFDPRDGLYYRSQEPNNDDGEGGVEVIDYGYEEGSVSDPEIIAGIDVGPTHNIFPHPEEPILYATNETTGDPGLDIVDVSEPSGPAVLGEGGPDGALHDMVVDPETDRMHCAYIFAGEDGFEGYAILDVSDPANPETVGSFNYAQKSDYTEVGEEGFELCHYADYDPERELAYVGDEKAEDVPGGKHVFDIGYDEGSPENPVPIGFTVSPNAEVMEEENEAFDWTTHNHDVISKGSNTLLVSGDYHEGTVVYDVSDPTDPTPTDRYRTDDAEVVSDLIFSLGEPPMAWGANYSEARDLVFTSDMITGVYTFKVTPARAKD